MTFRDRVLIWMLNRYADFAMWDGWKRAAMWWGKVGRK